MRRNSDLSTVVVVNDSFKPTTPTDLNLTLRNVKIPDYDEIKQILDAAEELFGQRIMGEPQDYADVDLLLSWIAKAYDGCRKSTKSKVHNPAGLVYWAFHKGKNTKIENKYLDLNKVNLPESFCRASGQWEFEDDHP